MVKGTVINLDFFPRGWPALANHFNPVKLLFIFEVYFTQKWGALPPPRPLPLRGACTQNVLRNDVTPEAKLSVIG